MLPDDHRAAEPSSTIDNLHDRRRPGRKNYTNQFLIALLRRPKPTDAKPNAGAEDLLAAEYRDNGDEIDHLRASRGIATALGLGLASWVIIGTALWAIFR
jgi:hypothetical protein